MIEPALSLIVPVYNERESLTALHAEITAVAREQALAVELRTRLSLDPVTADLLGTGLALMYRVLGTTAELVMAGLLYALAPSAARAAVRREAHVAEAVHD